MSKALDLFTAVPKMHNCAQAVACGAGRDDLNAMFAACGGGRAEGGMCGALYAALAIIPEADRAAAEAEFIRLNGSSKCRELKAVPISCAKCVEDGAALIEKYL